jgi:tetratricopeptide (TPR) repeat protein
METMNIPAEAEYLYDQARELSNKGNPKDALRYLREAITIDPHFSDAYCEMGNCQDFLGHNEESLSAYSQAIELDPTHADAWFNKGMALKKMGRLDEASQCIEKAIALYDGSE